MNKYELVYVAGSDDIRSKIYHNREAFLKDFQIIKASGKPMMAQGPDKAGKIAQVCENGWNNDDFALTAVVNFGSGKKYAYQASKHYSGMYEVVGRTKNTIVGVAYKWRDIDAFRAELFEAGYDNPTCFESILVKKVNFK